MKGFSRAGWSPASQLTGEELEKLLDCLGTDRDRGAEEYENLRIRLTLFFEHHRCASAEIDALVDETLNRMARKALAGEVIREPRPYALAVARFIAAEYHRRRVQSTQPVEEDLRGGSPSDDVAAGEIRAGCLDACIARLTPKQMQTMRWYFDRRRGDPPIPNSVRVRKNEIVRKILRPCCHRCFESIAGRRIVV